MQIESSIEKLEFKDLRLLLVCSTLNLDYPYGATPAIWQLLKAFFEIGCDTIVVPYRGKSIRSPWWRCYENPTWKEAELYAHSGMHAKQATGLRKSINDKVVPALTNLIITRKWRKLFHQVLKAEREVDAVMFVGVPLNQFDGLAEYVKTEFSCPLIYFDLDVPTSLPRYGGFSFDYYHGIDLEKYDAIIVPSEGVSDDLRKRGARKIFPVHFAVDPDLYSPVETRKDIDVFFFGTSDSDREKSISMMISEPSRKMKGRFIASGIKFNSDLGRAHRIPMLPFSQWRHHVGRSKINLNIPRERHASTYATSTSRPFELAAMKCAIVSSPYNGLETWFDIGKEIFIAKDSDEAIELYGWLMNDEEARKDVGLKAHKRVLKEHTFRHRAREIMRVLDELR